MSEIFTSTQAAVELHTDPKTLRRFLRADPTYRNVGSGGRYCFTEPELKTLRDRFNAWHSPHERKRISVSAPVQDDLEPPESYATDICIPPVTPQLLEKAREQEERLMARVKECGLKMHPRSESR